MGFTRYKSLVFAMLLIPMVAAAQVVPYGINYQAVARDLSGSELTNTNVDIRFSIISGTPLGNLEYQEIHSDVATSRYGVFTCIIGKGTPVAGDYELFSGIRWETANHYLKVEIKFASEYVEMGTMQFLSVPYALYAGRSLEPGPVGPTGPPGDPATDNQKLSFDGVNLWIDDGESNPTIISTVNLSSLVNDPEDEIQYLSIEGNSLSITQGNSILLQDINIDDADADPTNEIQDLRLNSNILKISDNPDATEIDLSHLVNDTDTDPTNEIQALSYNTSTHILTLAGGGTVNLSGLINDADALPNNELITGFSITGSEITISEGGNNHTVDLSSNMVAFRARKNLSDGSLNSLYDYDFIANNFEYNIGGGYNSTSGEFTAPMSGIYSFNIGYLANGVGDIRKLYIFLDGSLYETLQTNITGGMSLHKSITMKLNAGQVVKLRYNTGASTESGTGSFSGYKVF